MSLSTARSARVFNAGGHCFTWVEVVEWARARGQWPALQQRVGALLARERELVEAGALPGTAQAQAAADSFRHRHNLLTADELEEWLERHDVTVDEWKGEMLRSLLEPSGDAAGVSPDVVERACWVHGICSGQLAAYAHTMAEEIAVHLRDQPLTLSPDELAALPEERERFCSDQLRKEALTAEITDNQVGWTRLDLRRLIHSDEMVLREAALCVRLDGRALADVANTAKAELREISLLLDDAEPSLRTRLLAASPGELIGPVATDSGHQLVLVVRRVAPSLDDAMVRRRAEETVIKRALAAEVNRHVNWHERL
ncbi:hypothetical protein [Mycobacterium gastri]|uniref:Uncharacterized protein n=1 Tax=Mycobacterium gastri TaxID=1777 RepID=A0A1X1VGA2_MYCGS|nr:hypothetical protein [Mycobacterium gastri]ETW25237.1 hypothetical protein MGAST_03810 [Mycobacterium gastri 'Wayne']ORV68170.1 hypothetical protein AWC07_09025 [Mycobacterium gastri]